MTDGATEQYERDTLDDEEINPAHFCMGCNKWLGFRGFCSTKCHNEFYDGLTNDS